MGLDRNHNNGWIRQKNVPEKAGKGQTNCFYINREKIGGCERPSDGWTDSGQSSRYACLNGAREHDPSSKHGRADLTRLHFLRGTRLRELRSLSRATLRARPDVAARGNIDISLEHPPVGVTNHIQ